MKTWDQYENEKKLKELQRQEKLANRSETELDI